MKKYISRFFWMMVISAGFMVFTSSNPGMVGKVLPTNMGDKLKELKQLSQQLQEQSKEMAAMGGSNQRTHGNTNKKVANSKSQPVIKQYTGYECRDGNPPKYVAIRGKAYHYNPKNMYNVGGSATFYKPPCLLQVRKVAQVENNKRGRATQPSIKMPKIQNGLSAYNPANMKQTMDNIKKLQDSIQQRNKALDGLMDQ